MTYVEHLTEWHFALFAVLVFFLPVALKVERLQCECNATETGSLTIVTTKDWPKRLNSTWQELVVYQCIFLVEVGILVFYGGFRYLGYVADAIATERLVTGTRFSNFILKAFGVKGLALLIVCLGIGSWLTAFRTYQELRRRTS